MSNVVGYNDNFSKTNLTIEPVGCEYCMIYDWNEKKEKPVDFSHITFEGKSISYCPFCGRKVR